LQNLRDRFAPVVDEDFVDETETLMDAKKMLADTGTRFKNALKKLRERPQRMDDFPDNRMKIRFAFQQLLKKVVLRDPSASAKTPNEILEKEYPGEEEFIAFMDYYNQAKYSDQDIPEDAVDCARGILKQKL
jgi:DNA-binding transcriptional regulator PaaX